jgi:RNA polymerase sigma-70 factor (ECF subfamily)
LLAFKRQIAWFYMAQSIFVEESHLCAELLPQRRTPRYDERAGDGLQPSDVELLRAAAGGDGGAFHTLVDRHAEQLFRAALSMTPTRADAEELLQETLLGAFKSLARFDGRAAVKTWLNSILVRQAAKGWRRSSRHRKVKSIQPPDQTEHLNDPALHSVASAQQSDQKMDIMAALKSMPSEQQEIIVLREVQGLSYEDIASALGVPRGTVDSRLHRARAELRRRLSSYLP